MKNLKRQQQQQYSLISRDLRWFLLQFDFKTFGPGNS
jgi:hypothetical protein